jgi:hypothetical protein
LSAHNSTDRTGKILHQSCHFSIARKPLLDSPLSVLIAYLGYLQTVSVLLIQEILTELGKLRSSLLCAHATFAFCSLSQLRPCRLELLLVDRRKLTSPRSSNHLLPLLTVRTAYVSGLLCGLPCLLDAPLTEDCG